MSGKEGQVEMRSKGDVRGSEAAILEGEAGVWEREGRN